MLALSYDIGGTKLASGIVGRDGEVICNSKLTTPRTANDLLDAMESEAKKLLMDSGLNKNRIIGIGIGAPGPVDFITQKVVSFTNLPIEGFEVGNEIAKRLKINTFLDNDGNTAALGEHLWGATKNSDYSVMLTIGTGIGSGVIDKGQVVRGYVGCASEIGHMSIDLYGPPCKCGNKGCLESLVSGPAILRMALQDEKGLKRSSIYERVNGNLRKVTTEIITEQAIKGDKFALDLYTKVGNYLGVGIGNIINIFNPEFVVIGGGVGTAAGDILLEPAIEEAIKRALPASSRGVKILQTELGNDVGVIGAAALVFKESAI